MDPTTITTADSPVVADKQQEQQRKESSQHEDDDLRARFPNWYSDDDALKITNLSPAVRSIFTEYVGLKEEDVVPHILAVRKKAWKIFPYPCIGNFRFLDISLLAHPYHDDIVARLKSSALNPSHSSHAATLSSSPPEKFLDLGCCFAQDNRLLLHAGVYPSQLYAADLQKEFLQLGLELFQDEDRSVLIVEDEDDGDENKDNANKRGENNSNNKATYLTGDIFNPSHLKSLENNMDIIHIGSFLHLWDLPTQKKACKRIIGFLSKQESPSSTANTTANEEGNEDGKVKINSLIVGRQIGASRAGSYPSRRSPSATMYRHDPASFQKMWEDVAEEMGARDKWHVETKLINWGVVENRMVKDSMKPMENSSMVDNVEMNGLQFTVRCVE